MKILLTLFVLLFSSSVFANNYTSLQKWMLDKDPNDTAVIFYYTQRCNSLFVSMNKMFETESPELANKFLLIAADFYLFGIKFLAEIDNISLENSKSKYTQLIIKSSNLYIEDMKTNWLKNGSYYEGSYLGEDVEFCKTLYRTFGSENLF